MTLRGGLMVCGTTSDAGKSLVVAGLCRLLARRGVRVAPFKAQNMALNSAVTADGHEIGRAQAAQADAAGIAPTVEMNPVLLKPTSDRTSQLVVLGRPIGTLSAAEYHARKPELLPTVLRSLGTLRERYDVVVCEGAGSPAEINLLDHDIVNLRVAHAARLPAVIVGDIDRGGVFAALAGTVALLPDELRALVRGFVVNKLRGDPDLLGDATADLERHTGIPTLGVLPWLPSLTIDAEDSLALRSGFAVTGRAAGDALDVAVIRFPRVSNFTDLDPLAHEPGVGLRWVHAPSELGTPDLVILPGTKTTVDDLAWLRTSGLAAAITNLHQGLVLGICGGLQMLGDAIHDPDQVETHTAFVDGLGLLDVTTRFAPEKVTRVRRGTALGAEVRGYQIHHGRVTVGERAAGWIALDDEWGDGHDGAVDLDAARFLGTTLHGLFENDAFRATFLVEVGRRAGKTFVPVGGSFRAARRAQHDAVADAIEAHCDVDTLLSVIKEGEPA